MIAVCPLREFDQDAIKALLAEGYVSQEKYQVIQHAEVKRITFDVRRITLPTPYQKAWEATQEELRHYAELMQKDPCFGAFDGDRLVGVAITEVRQWNRSLWVWEIHIHKDYRRRGIGRRLMDALADAAQERNLRVLVCETQNTNVPAIDFYRANGLELEGIDLSYYSNQDVEAGEVALFMKRKILED